MARDQGRDDSAERDKYLADQRRQAAQARTAREKAEEARRVKAATEALAKDKPWLAGSAGVPPATRPTPGRGNPRTAREDQIARDRQQYHQAVENARSGPPKQSLLGKLLGKKKGT
ncbi:hypothetical protein LO772_00645 [Yinghuangia sp. ASG 101]|uniref:hypothetical protein n=1 Tax=Yinghuangia sp. ASG 101 TaxID=2896848 RepID=UPI001E52FC83|nr:hypothetical protein [Yinghuangia sp. ASG 101]UGQ12152.1 hypothetical protein LO772_00645 [Yinghuangia sp. ASG 101]